MIKVSTLNIQRAGAAKVHWLADLLFDVDFNVDILAVQELDLKEVSAVTFVEILRKRSVRVFLGGCEDGVYRCAILSRIGGAPVDLRHDRLAGAAFEFRCNGKWCTVTVASYYGCVSDAEVALRGVEHAVQELKKCQNSWILLGDFNLEALEEPLAGALARGVAWSWAEAFQGAELLPGTRATGRRIDFGLGCGRFFPVSVAQRWSFSDHAQVVYEVDLDAPNGHRGPTFRPLLAKPVTEQQWLACWPEDSFTGMLEVDQLDEAWTLLSNTAEDLLAEPGASGHRRAARWRPLPRDHDRSKAANMLEPLTLVQLRRLLRRMSQLSHQPGDQRLRSKAGNQMCALLPKAPWLEAVPYFEMEHWTSWMAERIAEEEETQKKAAIDGWRRRIESSESHMVSWIRRREKTHGDLERPMLKPEEVGKYHPVHIVEEATTPWMRRWGSNSVAGSVDQVLASHPRIAETPWDMRFRGEDLLNTAKSMTNKAAGPDGWECSAWTHLPTPFWHCFARLWQRVLCTGIVPQRWREGRVVLIPKSTSGHRPLTILSCAWRIGARIIVRQLASWIDKWASLRVLGGVAGRGLKDAFLRLVDSLDGHSYYLQEDLTKFFDMVRLPDLIATIRHLGCPGQLCQLVDSFYRDHRRVFGVDATMGTEWHVVRRGVAQGCPLSPVLTAAVMAIWSSVVEAGPATQVSSMSFVDDRLLWCGTVGALGEAKRRSLQFDKAYDLQCDSTKCRFVCSTATTEAQALQAELGYEVSDSLSLLGLVVPVDGSSAPSLKDFDLRLVKRRIYLIGIAARGLMAKKRMLQMLVIPMLTWAGGFATVTAEEMDGLCVAFRQMLHKELAMDTPPVLCYEVVGWHVQPEFAREVAALREAVRHHCREPPWIEDASIRLAAKKWPSLLPVTVAILTRLGWWWDPCGRFLHRRDSLGRTRSFELGVDSFEVVTEWLRDAYRRRFLFSCSRVARSRKRQEEDEGLAQGLFLPGPAAGTLATFEGHKWAWRTASNNLERRSALVTGCSTWYKQKRYQQRYPELPDCLCGQRRPSRPHLLWNCERTSDLIADVAAPTSRLEERLLACGVPEVPPPPIVLDYDDMIDNIAEAFEEKFAAGKVVFVATDGSVVDTVAAWAVAFEDDRVFSINIGGEDQSPFRAEVEGLVAQGFWSCALAYGLHLCDADCSGRRQASFVE